MSAPTQRFAVEKHGGSHGWHVVRVGPEHDPAFGQRAFICRYSTKRCALAHVRLLEGDASAAPGWYRGVYAHGLRRLGPVDGPRYAMASAYQLGLGAGVCNAHPVSGEPLAVQS